MKKTQGIAIAAMMIFVVGGYIIAGRVIRNADRTNAVHRRGDPVEAVLAANPQELLASCRTLLDAHRGKSTEVSVADRTIPEALRRLRPTDIRVSADSITVSFGRPVGDFGIVAFRPGLAGHGDRKWIDGLWLLDRQGVLVRGEPAPR